MVLWTSSLRLVDPACKRPRDIAALATQLDGLDGRLPGEEYSLTFFYRLLHKFVSNTGSHANLASLKRHTRREGQVLSIEREPAPIFSVPPTLASAALVQDLAADVFGAFGLPADGLPIGLRRPFPGDAGAEHDRAMPCSPD